MALTQMGQDGPGPDGPRWSGPRWAKMGWPRWAKLARAHMGHPGEVVSWKDGAPTRFPGAPTRVNGCQGRGKPFGCAQIPQTHLRKIIFQGIPIFPGPPLGPGLAPVAAPCEPNGFFYATPVCTPAIQYMVLTGLISMDISTCFSRQDKSFIFS